MSSPEIGWLFVDLNSYFASVEQEVRPDLRGRPVAVVPVEAETTCCIAVSYQAKAYGIQPGMNVSLARRMCPHLITVPVRPRIYVEYHDRIKAAIEQCIPVHQVLSCDEFACKLSGSERETVGATEIAYAIKAAIRNVGTTLRCSIGLGPNKLLAKMASEAQKPDGLMVLDRSTLPRALYPFALRDIPGVGERMERRLRAAGITTMRKLCAQTRGQMHGLWGSVLGDRLWLWLRGEDFPEPPAKALQTLSRQHILPPNCRNAERARDVAVKLLHTVARRMREYRLWTAGVVLQVGFVGQENALEGVIRVPPTQSTAKLQEYLLELWKEVPRSLTPSDLTVALIDLRPEPEASLFDSGMEQDDRISIALDAINARYGLNSVYFGSIHEVRKEAPTRIAFGPPPPLTEFEDADRDQEH